MKEYRVTMFKMVNGKADVYSINVRSDDPAMEIWLNPMFKNILTVAELNNS